MQMTNFTAPPTMGENRKGYVLLIAAWLAVVSVNASAQEESAELSTLSLANISGSVRGSYWSIPNNPSGHGELGIAELWLKAIPRVSQDTALVIEGWMRDTDVSRKGKTESVLRECYMNASNSNADFRIGKQIVVWGRADRLNPTDNLSPRDNTLFTGESDDQRQGTLAAKATYNFKSAAVSGFWLPYFRPNRQPLEAIPGVVYSETVPAGDQFAVKLEQSGQAVDWSLSYFRGFDLNPDISIGAVSPGVLDLALRHHRIRVLGADTAIVVGRYGLRAEIAYTSTEDANGTNPFIKNPFFYGVFGGDRTFFEYLNVNVQYFVREVSNYSDPHAIADPLIRSVALQQAVASNQLDHFQHGASLRISDNWLQETMTVEVAAVVNFTRHDYLLRPKLSYSFDDHWKGSFGANLYRGNSETYFGLLRDYSAMFAEIRYSF